MRPKNFFRWPCKRGIKSTALRAFVPLAHDNAPAQHILYQLRKTGFEKVISDGGENPKNVATRSTHGGATVHLPSLQAGFWRKRHAQAAFISPLAQKTIGGSGRAIRYRGG